MQDEKNWGKMVSHTKEIVIWLRFMADHTKLIAHFIDPSECRMSKMADDFIDLFDHLVIEARDLASMLYCHKGEVKAFHRFLLDIRVDVQKLRDFNKIAEDLISDCRLLSIMSVELAAHMKREAEHCLLTIALLEKELIKHCPEEFQDDVEDHTWEEPERIEENDEEPFDEDSNEDEIEDADEDKYESREHEFVTNERIELTEANDLEEEPVIAILPSDQRMEKNTVVESTKESLSHDIKAEEQVVLEVVENKIEEEPIEVPKRDEIKIYPKASEHKRMPKNFAGNAAPGERYAKPSKQHNLPRPLGKAKK